LPQDLDIDQMPILEKKELNWLVEEAKMLKLLSGDEKDPAVDNHPKEDLFSN